jgi:hypothetical protein
MLASLDIESIRLQINVFMFRIQKILENCKTNALLDAFCFKGNALIHALPDFMVFRV